MSLSIREATAADLPAIESLLAASDLPTADLASARPVFVVACNDSNVVGAGALQFFGDSALLRSMVVSTGSQRAGIGALVLQRLEELAIARGIRDIGLLTQTAKPFFLKHGYALADRQELPALHASDEFKTLCPASADCMRKRLNAASL